MTGERMRTYAQITPSREREVIEIIDTWDPRKRLTREELVRRVKQTMGLQVSRQGLMKREAIRNAFLRREKIICGDKPPRAKPDPLEVVLERRIEELQKQVADRDEQIDRFKQLFITHRYNAQQLGISPEMLEMPIPARGQVEKGRS